MKFVETSFTKVILRIIMIIFAIGAFLGIFLTVVAAFFDQQNGRPIDSSMFLVLAGYLGTPTAIAIGFYAWKSKAENILKITKSQKLSTNEHVLQGQVNTINALSNMGGQN